MINNKLIFKKSMALELDKRGHEKLETIKNRYKQGKDIFVFVKTERLMKDMTELSNK